MVVAVPCTVGLTGGLASGKSTVARLLAERGAAVLDADAVVRETYRPDGDGALAVASLFGEAVLAADGSVDRAALADLVLADATAREKLEAVIHPLVRRRVAVWLGELSCGEERTLLAVVEAALLVETGHARDYDVLVVVWCRPEQQLERAVRRGMEPRRAGALLAAQRPLAEKRAAADVVIDNSGGPAALARAVEQAWTQLLAACARSRG